MKDIGFFIIIPVLSILFVAFVLIMGTHSTRLNRTRRHIGTEEDNQNRLLNDAIQLDLKITYPLDSDEIYRNCCWNCKSSINSTYNIRCPKCGWFICSCCKSCSPECKHGAEYASKVIILKKKLNDVPSIQEKLRAMRSARKEIYDKEKAMHKRNYEIEQVAREQEQKRKEHEQKRQEEEKERERLLRIEQQCLKIEQLKRDIIELKAGDILHHNKFGNLTVESVDGNYIQVRTDQALIKIIVGDTRLLNFITGINKNSLK